MAQKKYHNTWVGLSFCSILILGLLFVEFQLSDYFNSKISKFIQVILIGSIGLLMQRTINLWLTTSSSPNSTPSLRSSSLLIHFVNLIITIATFLAIFFFALKQNFSSIITASGIISASLVFALKSIIMDAVSGFILDTDHRFKIGDWIRANDRRHGQIVKVSWRTTVLKDEYGYYHHVPNGNLISRGFTFIPQYCHDILTLKVNRAIPFERVSRILTSALMMLPDVRHQDCLVAAKDIENDGVVYEITFVVEHYNQRSQTRHKVLQILSDYLNFYNLNSSADEIKPSEKILKMIDIFQPLSSESLEKLSASLTQKSFAKDDIIVQQGALESSMYFIYEGVAKIVARQDEGRDIDEDIEIANLGPGQFFGDIALLMGKPRTATVKALTDMVVYEIQKEDLQPIFIEHPHLVEVLSQIIAERLSNKEKMFENYATSKEYLNEKKIILNEIKNFFGL